MRGHAYVSMRLFMYSHYCLDSSIPLLYACENNI